MARDNGGVKIERGWLQTAITVGTLIVAGTLAWGNLGSGVEANATKNGDQDKAIEQNAADIRRLDKTQARIDERLKAIEKGIQTLLERSDDR